METILIYNLNFAIITLLFYLFFRNKGVFQWNRWIIIAIPFISLFVSVIQFSNSESIKAFQAQLPDVVVSSSASQNTVVGITFSWIQWIIITGIALSTVFI